MIKEGIINVNKPSGMSSHDVIYVFRKLIGVRRIGHTGTLDPEAKGVLPVGIGTASRIPEYLELDYKTYKCSMYLGVTSETLDIWGKDVEDRREEIRNALKKGQLTFGDSSIPLTKAGICEAFAGFYGKIEQIPPKFSAVWVNGRRLYDYARNGQEVEIPRRTIWIEELKVEDIDLEELKVTYSVTCSKGTYIRTICSDVGEKLGCGAAMCELTRTKSGFFDIENAVDFEKLVALKDRRLAVIDQLEKTQKMPRGRMNDAEILSGGLDVLLKLYGVENAVDSKLRMEYEAIDEEINSMIVGIDEPLTSFGKATIITDELTGWFLNGGHIRMNQVKISQKPPFEEEEFPLEMREDFKRAYSIYAPKGKKYEGAFLGVAFYNKDYKKLVADKVFYRRKDI